MEKEPLRLDFIDLSLEELQKRFVSNLDCLDYLLEGKYPDHEGICDNCLQHTKFYPVYSRRAYICGKCMFSFSPTGRTLMHKTTTPLPKWFYAFWLIKHHPETTIRQLAAVIGVGYRTAWRINGLIRTEFDEDYFARRKEKENIYLLPSGHWRVITMVNKKAINIGTYKRREDAVQARDAVHKVLGRK